MASPAPDAALRQQLTEAQRAVQGQREEVGRLYDAFLALAARYTERITAASAALARRQVSPLHQQQPSPQP
jgi:hypothetical protein